MNLLRNLQAKVEGTARRAKAKGEEAPKTIKNYTEDGYVVSQVMAGDRSPEKVRGGSGYVHASSLIACCPRRHALMSLLGSGYKVPRSADRLVWAIGRAVEAHIRNQFIEQVDGAGVIGEWSCQCRKSKTDGFRPSVKLKCETCGKPQTHYGELALFDHEYRIVGSVDLLYARPDNHRVRVNEIKSINKKEFDLLTCPKGDHVWQALIYRRLLQRNGVDVDDKVAVIYGCKDYSFKGPPYLEFSVKPSPEHETGLDKMWKRAAEIRDFTLAKANKTKAVLPPRIQLCPHANTVTAKSCDQCNACFASNTP